MISIRQCRLGQDDRAQSLSGERVGPSTPDEAGTEAHEQARQLEEHEEKQRRPAHQGRGTRQLGRVRRSERLLHGVCSKGTTA